MSEPPDPVRTGVAGRIARAFIGSKLTPLLIIASILLGLMAVSLLPREEEPQIIVPMADVFVAMPGAPAAEVAERVTGPMERLLWEVPGVEYLYSTSSPGAAMVVVRFRVGEDEERALVRLNEKLRGNFDLIPPGASPPLVKSRSIDDVPVLALTLWSPRHTSGELRRIAAELRTGIKQVPDVSEVTLIGGEPRTVRVLLDPEALAARGLAPAEMAAAVRAANLRLPAGAVTLGDRELLLEAGGWLADGAEAAAVVVGASAGRPVRLGDVARVVDGPDEPTTYVHHLGRDAAAAPAVTIAVAKRRGKNAVEVVGAVLARVEELRGRTLPHGVELTVTRDYGRTAREKSDELLLHMLIAVFGVALLVGLALGRRESLIVLLAIPATLALTLAVFYFLGYTLNRITLFALIFSIGILVDDAIVVVENIVRHGRMAINRGRDAAEVAVRAVDEVGNPTILATMTVVAAILPMAFVGGLMGPYMRPIPVGSTAAMLFSLLIAFIVTPWAAVRLLGRGAAHEGGERESLSTRLYRRVMGRLIAHGPTRAGFLASVVALFVISLALVAVGWVKVKMLPFDNKSEMQVIVDLPEGTTLERAAATTRELAEAIRREPEVESLGLYVGTSGPYNFNGLVRHYFLRRGPNVADIQVNLVGKGERDEQSHAIARRLRARLLPVAARTGARIKVAEVPPGPPVLQTLVVEVYGPEHGRRIEIARQVEAMLEATPGVVDVDTYVEDEQGQVVLEVDQEKAALAGVRTAEVAAAARLAGAGETVGLIHPERAAEDVPLVLRLARADRGDLERLRALRLRGRDGGLVALGEVVRTRLLDAEKSIYHKNLMPVVYVTADVAGEIESPVYAILDLRPRLAALRLPEGYAMEQHTARVPASAERYSLKWDGEWHVTYEVFRDLGLAFAAVLLLIYVLVVAWFESFLVPLCIMSAIPFSLVGILPAHGLLGAFFTATSMIGFIAGAGIVVRNSIILVDFIELRLAQGMPLDQAVVDAGAVRFRPMLLTAAAVVVGAAVILFDPIFQGLAISLMAGEVASLFLSRMTVPVIYFLAARRRAGRATEVRP